MLIEGYFVIESFEIVEFLAKNFNSLKKTVVFTLSATFMVEVFHDKMVQISNLSDIIFCNNEEAEKFAKVESKDVNDHAIAIHKKLSPNNKRVLVITCGAEPSHISQYDYDNSIFEFVIRSYVVPIPANEIIDTTGCGDCKLYFIIISLYWRILVSVHSRQIFRRM